MVNDNGDEAVQMQYFWILVKSLIKVLPEVLITYASSSGYIATDQLCKLISWCAYHSAFKSHHFSI